MRLYFAASLITATIFLAGPRPAAAMQVPQSDLEYRARAKQEFAQYDPAYESSRAERVKQARVLGKQVFQREAVGQPSECSHQILNEISWLLGYTANFNAVDRRLKDLQNTLAHPDLEVAASEQNPSDGSWGRCYTEWFFNGRRAIYVQTDVTKEAEVKAMVERVEKELGPVEILVNDAGIGEQVLLHEMSSAQWDRMLNVNLRSVFLCTRYVLPQMLERGSGKIISVGSQLGQIGGHEMVHYSASKGGVLAFTKALAREVSTKGVRVNAIAPGPILTDMMKDETDEWRDKKLAEMPIGRFGQAHEVAPTAVFLASDDSSYYVGQTLGPNGGDVML